jgi:hypothetical protein
MRDAPFEKCLSKKLVAIPYERAYGEPNQNVVFDNLLRELAGAGGFEPPHGGIKIRCLTAWRRPNAAFYPRQPLTAAGP